MDKSEIYRILNDAYFPETCDEKEVLEYLPTVLHNCQVFVDVGASLGQYTFFANKYLRGGEIFAIEADPIRFEELKRNCEKWESSSGNALTAIHAAVSDNDGQTTFYTTRSNVSGGLFKHDIAHQAVEWSECIVDCITLDTLFKDSSPDFVKIDVEGSEFQVLSGARRILSEGKARFLVEMHGWEDCKEQTNPVQVFNLMKSYGYYPIEFHGRTLFVRGRTIDWWKARLRAFLRRLRSLR